MGDKQNHKALPENTKDTTGKKFPKVLLCICVFFVFGSKKSQPKKKESKMQHNFAPFFCFLPSVIPRLRPEKHLSDLFFPVEYLGDGQRGLEDQS